jgi:hypothetical protein
MRNFLFVLLLSSCAAPSSDIVVDRENLKANISAFEGGDSSARLAALQGDVAGALMALSEDPSEKPFFRARAFQALSNYPEPRVFEHMKRSMARYETLGFVILPQAIQSLSAFNELYPEEVTALLQPLTAGESLIAKEMVIRVLATNPSVQAKDLLSSMALRETEPVIQDALRAANVLR